MAGSSDDMYYDGSTDVSRKHLWDLDRMTERAALTKSTPHLVVVMVGLPGRGKSFIARKLKHFLRWKGMNAEVFNVGYYRRQIAGSSCLDSSFFDPNNKEGARQLAEACDYALTSMLAWLTEHNNCVAIFDATNTTKAQRRRINDMCLNYSDRTSVVFIETICKDESILESNLFDKAKFSPDYVGKPLDVSLEDLRQRCRYFESVYETIDENEEEDLSFIKLYDLSSQVLSNKVYGSITKTTLPFLMSLYVGTRSIFLLRAGDSCFADDKPSLSAHDPPGPPPVPSDAATSSGPTATPSLQQQQQVKQPLSAGVGDSGFRRRTRTRMQSESEPRDAAVHQLHHHQQQHCHDSDAGPDSESDTAACDSHRDSDRRDTNPSSSHELSRDSSVASVLCSGAFEDSEVPVAPDAELNEHGQEFARLLGDFLAQQSKLFYGNTDRRMSVVKVRRGSELAISQQESTVKVLTSTLPRACDTARLAGYLDGKFESLPTLNPLDQGALSELNMEQIMAQEPEFYRTWVQAPFETRFPGGESYSDLIARLEPVLVDIEQQTVPVVIISHLSVLQALHSYFDGDTDVTECWKIPIPIHTVIEFTPLLGGSFRRVEHELLPEDN